jgi:hypothetical protein
MVMEQQDNLHKLVVVIDNNLDQDLALVNLVYSLHLLDFVGYSSNLVVFSDYVVVVFVGDFDFDCKSQPNDVKYYSSDQEEHRHIYGVR